MNIHRKKSKLICKSRSWERSGVEIHVVDSQSSTIDELVAGSVGVLVEIPSIVPGVVDRMGGVALDRD